MKIINELHETNNFRMQKSKLLSANWQHNQDMNMVNMKVLEVGIKLLIKIF